MRVEPRNACVILTEIPWSTSCLVQLLVFVTKIHAFEAHICRFDAVVEKFTDEAAPMHFETCNGFGIKAQAVLEHGEN